MAGYHLGINLGHDRAAALVRNGEIAVAIHQERLDRCKHSIGILHQAVDDHKSVQLPDEAIRYCLDSSGASWSDVVTVSANMPGVDYSYDILSQRLAPELATKVIAGPTHHLSHAYSAYWPSGFDEALIFVVDATGSTDPKRHTTESYTLYHAVGSEIKPLHSEVVTSHLTLLSTLGFIYEYISRKAGFQTRVGSTISVPEAGKLMGLAPFGGEQKNWHRWVRTRQDDYSLDISPYDIFLEVAALEKTYDKGEGKPYLRPYLVDLAWKVQHELEEALLHIIGLAISETGVRKLCLAGGVALNSVANYKLYEQLELEDIFIFPAAGDAGVAAGNALWAYATHEKKPVRTILKKATLGATYPSEVIKKALTKYSEQITATSLSFKESVKQSAVMLSRGHIVARFEGGSEYGPRALGHRSIMADPVFPQMKDIVNARVKFREAFRPFAPVIPLEDVGEVFDHSVSSPFMLLVSPIKPEYQSKIPAVTHFDGTGRVQTVTEEDNPAFYRICREMAETREGPPVILNTSFNVAGQPIVETPEEAIATFLNTDIDYLCLENYWISKKNVPVLSYQDHLDGLPANVFPKGLESDQQPVTDLMKKLDRAIFYGEKGETPWTSEELRELSAEGGRYKETSVLFPENPFGRRIRTQVSQYSVLLLDPLGHSMLIDRQSKISPGKYNFEETVLIMAVLDGEAEHLKNLRIKGPYTTREWEELIAWACRQLAAFNLEPGVRVEPANVPDSKLPKKSKQIFSSFADQEFSARNLLRELQKNLVMNGYTEGAICGLLKLDSLQMIEPTYMHYYDRYELPDDALGDLIRFFLLQVPLVRERIVDLFGKELFEGLVRLGIFRQHGHGEWVSRIDLFCVDSLYIATDHRFNIYGQEDPKENPVMYIGLDSMGLVHVAPRYPVSRMLDLCTGSGIQAIVGSRNALQVTGVDINPRSIRFARFNAQLNGIDNVRFVEGDLYEPVSGMIFDVIHANPPFVPSPHGDLHFRDGGNQGDAVLCRIIESAGDYLSPEGNLHIVSDLVNVDSFETKLSSFWKGGEADILILQTANRNEMQFSVPHSHASFGQEYDEYNLELDRWVDNYRAMKIKAVNFGYTLIHGLPAGLRGSFYQRTINNPKQPIYHQVQNYFKQRRLFEHPKRDMYFLDVNQDIQFRIESSANPSSRRLEIFFPDNPYFTTYIVTEEIFRGIENIVRSKPQYQEFVSQDNQEWTNDLILKGIITLNTRKEEEVSTFERRIRARPQSDGQGSEEIQELETETTPTCLSTHLLR